MRMMLIEIRYVSHVWTAAAKKLRANKVDGALPNKTKSRLFKYIGSYIKSRNVRKKKGINVRVYANKSKNKYFLRWNNKYVSTPFLEADGNRADSTVV